MGLPGYLVLAEDLQSSQKTDNKIDNIDDEFPSFSQILRDILKESFLESRISDACGPIKRKADVFENFSKESDVESRSVHKFQHSDEFLPIYAKLFDLDSLADVLNKSQETGNDEEKDKNNKETTNSTEFNRIQANYREILKNKHQIEL